MRQFRVADTGCVACREAATEHCVHVILGQTEIRLNGHLQSYSNEDLSNLSLVMHFSALGCYSAKFQS